MKQIFTQVFIFLIVLVATNSLYAQSFFEITEPAEVAGTFDIGVADFYQGCLSGTFTGELAIADDGTEMPTEACMPITNDVSGKIALIDRGNCPFVDKALNAQDAGAIAVIICNNLAAPLEGSGIPPLGGTSDTPITIPVVGLSLEDCAAFRTSIPLTGTINLVDRVQNVIWGNEPGQGDFNGGINDWTAVTVSCNGSPSEFSVWQWRQNADAPRGSFGGGVLVSPTSCDGAMAFDSDFYDNNGDVTGGADDPAFGSGPCPASQVGELISPIIDISGADVGGVSVSFYQAARQFDSNFLVGFSLDGGETWTDIPVNTDVAVNDAIDPEDSFQVIPLPGAVGADSLRIRFRMEGNYYFWIVDDVKIVEGFANNLIIEDAFYTPISVIQPTGLIATDTFLFQVIVRNDGTNDQTNVNVVADIEEVLFNGERRAIGFDQGLGNLLADNPDIAFNVVYTDTTTFESVSSSTLDTLQLENLYAPDLPPGFYRIAYRVLQEETDQSPDDNFTVNLFAVSDDFYAKEFDFGNSLSRGDDGTAPHSYVNFYTIPEDTQEDFVVGEILFRSTTNDETVPLDGSSINVYVLEETEDFITEFDGNSTSVSADGLLEFRGFAEYIFPDGAGFDHIGSTALESFDDEGNIPLVPGVTYGAATEYLEPSAAIFQVYDSDIDVSGTNLIRSQWFGGYTGDVGFAPVIRMQLALSTSIDETPLPDGTMKLFPNPATEYVQAAFNFEQQIDATITLATIEGKVIEYRNQPLLNDIVNFNTGHLAEGMYILRVATEIGTRTEKFMVQHP